MKRVTSPAASSREPAHRRFRLIVVVASVLAAAVGSLVLATRDPGEKATTRGITATLRVPGHPGPVAAGADALWVALNGDPARPAGDRPLLRLDLATGAVVQTVHLGGEVSYLVRDAGRLIASVKPVGGGALGSRRLVALDWRTGAVLPLGDSHLSDADARRLTGRSTRSCGTATPCGRSRIAPARCCNSTRRRSLRSRSDSTLERPDARAGRRRRSPVGDGDRRRPDPADRSRNPARSRESTSAGSPSASPSPAETSGSPTALTAASFASTRARCGRSAIPSRSAESRPGSG